MMQPKVYQAPTMAMALGEVKKDLGPSALILQTRHYRQGKLLGLFGGRKMWEVRAAPNAEIAANRPASPVADSRRPVATDTGDKVHKTPVARPAESGPVDHDALATKMAEIHRMVGTLLSGGPARPKEELPVELALWRQHLLDQDVDKEIAGQLIDQLNSSTTGPATPSEDVLRARLTDIIAKRINVAEAAPDRQGTGGARLVSLIGPTGVGKTTTIAKLAAICKIHHRKSVGLITIDSYRIAAVDQLRTYAEIIDVPLEAVLTPGELHRAVRRMSELDTVLIDTAGRSQNDEMKLNELRTFIEAAECDEVHLVVSAASSPKVAKAAAKRFSTLKPNRIIISKLDEAETFGMILNLVSVTDAKISYVTTGQDVPDDMAPAKRDVLADCVMRGSRNAS